VFVADVIPSELLKIIEFLNKQMDPAEAIAVEVRQFVGEGMRTLVPRVLGQTEPSRERVARSAGRQPVGKEVFWRTFAEERPATEHVVMRKLEQWAVERGLEPTYLTGQRGTVFSPKLVHDGNVLHPIAAGRKDAVMLNMRRLVACSRLGDPQVQEELYDRIRNIPGLVVTDAGISGLPKIPLASLADAAEFERFRAALDWMLEVIRGTEPA